MEKEPDFIPKLSLFGEMYKDNTNKPFLEIFNPELLGLIISLLRKNGFFVITYFDIHTNKRRILVSSNKFNQVCANQFSNAGSFISIEIKSETQKNQRAYKNSILKSGGSYIGVHSLVDFYTQFKSITGEAL